MNLNIKQLKNDFLFVPLGGAGEIGMNLNLYHYKGKWLIVDCGAGFADEFFPGVDMIVPDINFLIQHQKDIVGMVITHAHEDHLGAIQYLWDDLRCPIYTTKFTANFLRHKLKEFHFSKEVKINEIEPDSSLKLEPFDLDFVSLTHSAPEMQGVLIKTPEGKVFHTGDWKFDEDPLIGEKSNEEKLKKFGLNGVCALVGDSTNVFNPGVSGSEGALRKSLVDIIAGFNKLVVVTTFASNLARVETLMHAAAKTGRQVVFTGRSLHRMYQTAQESGYLENIAPVIDERDIGRHDRSKILVIATGCQGEPMAAIAKISNGNQPNIKLSQGDAVIFSSKIIPGNDKRIFSLFNSFAKRKIEVITERDHFVHVSGHPAIEELKRMYELIKPKTAIPVHGELVHIHEHAKIAKSCGVKNTVESENGVVIKIHGEQTQIIGAVQSGYMAIDGNYLLDAKSEVLKMRRRMRDSGIIITTVLLKNEQILGAPIISAPGCLDSKEDKEILELLQKIIKEETGLGKGSKRRRVKTDNIENIIRSTIKRFIKEEIGKTPIIEVNLVNIKS